ncbi:MAG: MraY family glycosyltransferase [Steroidobacteraceae bacterium]|jgi:UDP-GlcNAc:undecaprenyl-phosphate GlcNAc-1-phosphate transferase
MRYVMPFILAMVATMASLPLLAKLGTRWLIIDRPGVRKVHAAPIPRVGGLAMAVGVLVAAALAIRLQPQDRWFLVAGAVLVVFGALDDRFDLDYRVKLLGQLIAVGIVVILANVQVHAITLDDRVMLPGWISLPLTVFFLVGVTNAVNLADGLDGLAGGTTFLCLCAVALLSSVGDQSAGTALCLTFAGAVLGFLRFNTYPASVFMGDAGSQLLGFAIGVLSVRATQNPASQVSAAIPILLLALPILDTLSVMVQRIGEGRSPFSADKNHIHHKLLALGFGHHEAVMVIYAVQAGLFLTAYFLRFESDLTIIGFVTIFFIASITVMQLASRSGWRLRGSRTVANASALSRIVTVIQQPKLLPRLSYLTIAVALAVYAGLIVSEAAVLSSDIRLLIGALFAVVIAFSLFLRAGPLNLVEKAALYVTVTVLVYLDAVVLHADRLSSILTWIAVSIAALATAIRLRLQNDRRFQLTPLDLIVLFMALVVPSLPGTFHLPHGGALSIAKLLILFYSIEMLVTRSEGRPVWLRVAVVAVLGGLAVRPLISF